MTNKENAQNWFDGQIKENNQEVESEEVMELEGPLVIDEPNVERIILDSAGLTDLTFGKKCSKVRVVSICDNKLTEIKGLENLPNLEKLYCGNNSMMKELKITENSKLEILSFSGNPDIKFVIKNARKLTFWASSDSVPIPLGEMGEEELKEIAAELGIKENEMQGKDVAGIIGLIKDLGKVILENESKLNKDLNGLLDNQRKVNDAKLEEIKKALAELEKAKAILDKVGIKLDDPDAGKKADELKQNKEVTDREFPNKDKTLEQQIKELKNNQKPEGLPDDWKQQLADYEKLKSQFTGKTPQEREKEMRGLRKAEKWGEIILRQLRVRMGEDAVWQRRLEVARQLQRLEEEFSETKAQIEVDNK